MGLVPQIKVCYSKRSLKIGIRRKGIEMVQEDWLKKGITESHISEKIMGMWESILWCAENLEVVLKLMGERICEEEERLQIQQKLSQDHQYELRVAMIYAECERRQEKIENRMDMFSFIQKREEREVSNQLCFDQTEEQENRVLLLPYYQLLSFLCWCDKKDWADIFEKPSIGEWYRLCYLALMVGYQELAFYFMKRMGKQMGKEKVDILERYGKKLPLLQRKWVMEFYQKQPEGKEKKKLVKRMLRYGIKN